MTDKGKVKGSDKIDKYLDLSKELKKVTVILIEVGSLGIVSKSLERRLEELEIRERDEAIQTTALLRSVRIPWDLRKFTVAQISVKDHQFKLVWKYDNNY